MNKLQDIKKPHIDQVKSINIKFQLSGHRRHKNTYEPQLNMIRATQCIALQRAAIKDAGTSNKT